MHGKQHAAMHRLEAVARIGQRPPDYHAHRVFEIRFAHLLFEADRQGFFGELFHVWQYLKKAYKTDCNFSMPTLPETKLIPSPAQAT